MSYPFPAQWEPSAGAKVSAKVPHMHIPASKEDKILPKDNQKNILITSALPYVNNHPHLGNIIGSTLSADVYARFSRTRNRNTLYICGTDEYGTATETKALEDGVTPQELCDKYHALHRKAYTWFEIGFDHFGRTTTPQQTVIAQDIFLKLNENGFLQEKAVTQLYCEKDQRFLADRYVEGICPKCGYDDARGDQCDKCGQLLDAVDLIKPRCKTCSSTPVIRESKHMYILIDNLQPTTEKWARQAMADGHWSLNGRQITEHWFKEGLRPFSLTRDLKWGVPVPLAGMEGKVFYVWFDAPIGYPSITANYTEDWEKWWKNPENVKLYQFMGKDNVRFHTVIFPSCLLGTKQPWTMLDSISTTEYLQYEGGKFSKSRNVGVFGDKAAEVGVSPSVWRYYLLINRPETADSQFVWHDFVQRNNSELVANVGNFVNRVLSFTKKYDYLVPDFPTNEAHEHGLELEKPLEGASGPYDGFVKEVNSILAQYVDAMDSVKLRAGLQLAMAVSGRGNLFLSEQRLDNALYANERAKCDLTLLLAINLIYTLTPLLHPFMPSTSAAILEQLNAPPTALPDDGKPPRFGIYLLPGHKLGTPAHLFKRIDEKMVDVWRAQFGGTTAAKAAAAESAPKAAGAEAVPTGPDGKPLSKKQAEKQAKAAKKAAAAAAAGEGLKEGQKTPEFRELEVKVKDQGEKVRLAKVAAKDGGDAGSKVDDELAELLRLKKELVDLTAQLAGTNITS
ncbi:methionine--tRNA ligase mes1 [Tilletia horrida]|nr:methionine--tRNA ligase mes1 [Tilletia horrida]KAK0568220.1 methionine--tRNA ligase mes1 [Tilletia horrida]